MRVVNQPIEDAISQRGIADLCVAVRLRELRCEDRRGICIFAQRNFLWNFDPQVWMRTACGYGEPRSHNI